MARATALKFDETGYWSEIKLDIVKKYAAAYSRILSAQSIPRFEHVYIDAFSGAGIHLSKTSGDFVPGSPINALYIEPPFREYHFIDLNPQKTAHLQELIGARPDVHIYEGDCNQILLEKVFPHVRYEDFRRGLCLLDPYGLNLNWNVVSTAGKMRTIDMFLNFPVMDMNRNVWRKNPEGVNEEDIQRMNTFWGDESWRNAAYRTEEDLFGLRIEKETNETIAGRFCERLKKVAGFGYVSEPLPMRNSRGTVVYYLIFASQKAVAKEIILDIFETYKNRGA